MEWLYLIIFFILGLVLGSFFNVVGYRLPRGERFSKGRSICPNCKHKLSWYELIPLFSFLFQKGKCRHCNSKIALFYPIIELSCGLLFMICYYSFGFSYELLLSLSIVSLFLIVLVSDLLYLIIPDEIIIFFGIIFLILQTLILGFPNILFQLGSSLILFLFMFFLMKLGLFLFKKESLGGGDVKLMALVGLVLHPILGILVVFLASLIALPISLVLLYTKKEKVIPFGPFLVLSFLLLFLMKIDINSILMWFGF